MLFHKSTKRFFKIAWIVIGILVIIGMVLLYTPIFFAPTNTPPPVDTTTT